MRRSLDDLEPLAIFIDLDTRSRCWNWTGEHGKIPIVRWQGTYRSVRRVLWEHLRGTIPIGITLHATCDNRRCVNPAHMRPARGTREMTRGMGERADTRDHVERGIDRLAALNEPDDERGFDSFTDRSAS